jgi:hypothetical protein
MVCASQGIASCLKKHSITLHSLIDFGCGSIIEIAFDW